VGLGCRVGRGCGSSGVGYGTGTASRSGSSGVAFGTGTAEGMVRLGGGGCGVTAGWVGGVRLKARVRRGWGECLARGEVGWVGREGATEDRSGGWCVPHLGVVSDTLGMTDPESSGLTPLIQVTTSFRRIYVKAI